MTAVAHDADAGAHEPSMDGSSSDTSGSCKLALGVSVGIRRERAKVTTAKVTTGIFPAKCRLKIFSAKCRLYFSGKV